MPLDPEIYASFRLLGETLFPEYLDGLAVSCGREAQEVTRRWQIREKLGKSPNAIPYVATSKPPPPPPPPTLLHHDFRSIYEIIERTQRNKPDDSFN
jgi:hypothetical protein